MVPKEAIDKLRLDAAIERADELLVTSLKQEERRRGRRRVVFVSLGVLLLGGIAMSVILCFVFLGAGTGPQTAGSNGATQVAVALDNSDDAGRLTQEGWSLWQNRKFEDAAGKFDEAVKLDPKNVAAWNGLGWASFNGGNYEPAGKAFQKAIALEPKHPAALNGLGQLALTQRKYKQAEDYLLKAAPQASAAWYGLTKVYLLTGKYDKAAKWAEKIIRSGDADPELKKLLAAAKKHDLPADLRRSIEPDPNATEVMRAWQLMNQGRSEDAKALFTALLAKAPKDSAALNGMGWCLLNSGKADEAKPYFERAIAADPEAAGAMNGLARALSAEGDTDGAIKIWQKMVDKFPGPHAGTYGLANAYYEKGEFKKAIPLLEQLAKANANDADIAHKLDESRKQANAAK
jgi:tetratricopeptide (TPR) repeat protein